MKTAVDWLYSEWAKNGTIFLEDLEQAKEMEKEQLEKEWRKGYIEGLKDNKRITKYPSGCAG
jgi:hypothetical protein